MTFTATASGTFYIEAGGYGERTGSYTVAVIDTTPETQQEDEEQQEPAVQVAADADDVRAGATDLGDIAGLDGQRFPNGSVDGAGDPPSARLLHVRVARTHVPTEGSLRATNDATTGGRPEG